MAVIRSVVIGHTTGESGRLADPSLCRAQSLTRKRKRRRISTGGETVSDSKRITPDTDDHARLDRILQMQHDLAALLTVSWGDVHIAIQRDVLKHAAKELKKGLEHQHPLCDLPCHAQTVTCETPFTCNPL